MVSRFRRKAPALVLLAVAACLGKPAAVPVQGEAFCDNQPVAGALIIFHPSAEQGIGALRPTATVDEKGAFTPSSFKPDDGLPEGEYAVTVIWPDSAKTGSLIRSGEGGGNGPDRLQGRYNDPKNPQLTVRIHKGEVNKLRFDLK